MKMIKKPILMILGIIVCLVMIRLGVWQLDRADQKQTILNQSQQRAELPAVPLASIVDQFNKSTQQHRFSKVSARGYFLPNKSILIDNQVHDSKVGYFVITPFQLQDSDKVVLVNRGWVAIGESRSALPKIDSTTITLTIHGRLNKPVEQPPLWNDDYPVFDGSVWQYLPIPLFRQQTQLNVLSLVIELAPDVNDGLDGQPSAYVRQWKTVDNESVNKHKAYALQWFSMALVFFIACLVLLFKTRTKN